MQGIKYLLFSQLLALPCLARDVPSNLASFFSELKSKGDCSNKLATGFFSSDGGPNGKFQTAGYRDRSASAGTVPQQELC